ncbi:hypothetical protein Hte_003967 [Hypoxylon texense]
MAYLVKGTEGEAQIDASRYDEAPPSRATQDLSSEDPEVQSVLVPVQADDQGIDSGIAMSFDATAHDPLHIKLTLEYDGVPVQYTLGQVSQMAAALSKARTGGLFPRTKASVSDVKATVQDYFDLLSLNDARAKYPSDEWNQQPEVVNLLMNITRDIKVRDKLAAEKSEDERVKAHVANMMSGVGAEAKLYNIVKHAVAHSLNNGSSEEAATLTGQSMIQLLNGIRGTINDMASQGTHGVSDHNVGAVVEEVFKTIDFALSNFANPLDKNVKDLGGRVEHMDDQIQHVDGQILHLNAIGQHVNAIDGHVHSLGNNLNSMGTLLNSTNGNVVSMTTQVALLQTIVNMLPQLISQACDQQLRHVLETVLGPAMQELGIQLDALHNDSKFKRLMKKVKNLFKKSS